MYRISDQQIDYILSDISARGVALEGLQLNLLDHICCIVERELEENGDFEQFYQTAIRRFYRDKLSEIEEETHLLLNNKNYYAMKKVMITSGAFSTFALTFGIILKFLHAPGASALIVLGIGSASLVFLPLMVVLKMKEQQQAKDKLLLVLGAASGIMMSLGVLFKVQHWPGANIMGMVSPMLLLLVFLPVYFFSGIRNAATKVNTIVSSVIIILGCGLFFTLVASPASIKLDDVRSTTLFLRSEEILRDEEQRLANIHKADSAKTDVADASKNVYAACEKLKAALLEYAAGAKAISKDFERRNEIIRNASLYDFLAAGPNSKAPFTEASQAIFYYNKLSAANNAIKPIQVQLSLFDENTNHRDKVMAALTDLIQIQMQMLQSQL